jgi:periplasmic protein TonB
MLTWQKPANSNRHAFFIVVLLHIFGAYGLLAHTKIWISEPQAPALLLTILAPSKVLPVAEHAKVVAATPQMSEKKNIAESQLIAVVPEQPNHYQVAEMTNSPDSVAPKTVNATIPTNINIADTPPFPQRSPEAITAPQFGADYLHNPAPNYPALSRRAGEQGKVLLHVFVNAHGTANTVEIRQTSGFPRLDTAAAEAVQQWKFIAARRGEEDIAAWVLVPIHFNLRG